MARKPRIHFPGAFYHIMLRGNGGQDIFLSDADRIRFSLLLQEGVERYKHRIHAFCLMGNHVHLLVQVGDASLSPIMQNISFRFSRYFNTQQKRVGHLFQGRYKALLIDNESYILELVRYIHCNPVRSGLVKNPDEYPWSSHPAYLGKTAISWLTRESVLSHFAKSQAKASTLYAEFVQEGIAESHRHEFHRGSHDERILGADSFTERALALANQKYKVQTTLSQIIDAICLEYGITAENLSEPGKKRVYAEARAIAAFLVQEEEHLSLTDLAKCFNRDLSTLSRAAGRIRERLRDSSRLSERISFLKKQLT